MKLEYSSKSLEYGQDNQPSRAKVILTNPEGAIYPVFLPADVINDSDAELLEKALEVIYEINFPHRAENEKFNIMGEKLAEFDAAMDEANEAVEELRQTSEEAKIQMSRNEQKIDAAVAELTNLVLGTISLPSEEVEVEE